MLSPNDDDLKCEYFNAFTRRCHPSYSGFEDKPFGSEMRYGRGVCDTDPIPEQKIRKTCRIEDRKLAKTATRSIDESVFNRYSKDGEKSLILEYRDARKEKEIEKQFLKDPATYIPPFGFRTLLDSLTHDPNKKQKHSCKENEQKLETKAIILCGSSAARGTSGPDSINALIVSSSIGRNDSEANSDKAALKRQRSVHDIKGVGPFTELRNPGEQMKLGEPYHVRSGAKKGFYKDF